MAALASSTRARDLLRHRAEAGGDQLAAFLRHVVETVPAYADVLTPDLAAFPLVDRQQLRVGRSDYYSSTWGPDDVVIRTTSGTTGIPLEVPRDAASDYCFIYGTYRRVFDRLGILSPPNSERCAVVQVNDNPSRPFQQIINPDLGHARMYQVVLDGTASRGSACAQFLVQQHPQLLSGRPRALESLLSHVLRTGQDLAVQAILCTGDNLYPDVRERLEKGFRAPVFNGYASQECGMVALECPHQDGLVTFSQVTVEVAPAAGAGDHKATTGTGHGTLVVTSANNWAMPIVRYLTGDDASVCENDLCRCGPQVVSELSGRDSPFFEFAKGRINPSILNPAFEALPIRQFRVVQEAPGAASVEWVGLAADEPTVVGGLTRAFETLGCYQPSIERVERIGRPEEKVQRFVRR